jgi:hypothetical protein
LLTPWCQRSEAVGYKSSNPVTESLRGLEIERSGKTVAIPGVEPRLWGLDAILRRGHARRDKRRVQDCGNLAWGYDIGGQIRRRPERGQPASGGNDARDDE